LEKQLKYADQKQIPYVMIIGPEEVENNSISIKDMRTRNQETINVEEFINRIKKQELWSKEEILPLDS
jgi:histidyl-tRNA synthetase